MNKTIFFQKPCEYLSLGSYFDYLLGIRLLKRSIIPLLAACLIFLFLQMSVPSNFWDDLPAKIGDKTVEWLSPNTTKNLKVDTLSLPGNRQYQRVQNINKIHSPREIIIILTATGLIWFFVYQAKRYTYFFALGSLSRPTIWAMVAFSFLWIFGINILIITVFILASISAMRSVIKHYHDQFAKADRPSQIITFFSCRADLVKLRNDVCNSCWVPHDSSQKAEIIKKWNEKTKSIPDEDLNSWFRILDKLENICEVIKKEPESYQPIFEKIIPDGISKKKCLSKRDPNPKTERKKLRNAIIDMCEAFGLYISF